MTLLLRLETERMIARENRTWPEQLMYLIRLPTIFKGSVICIISLRCMYPVKCFQLPNAFNYFKPVSVDLRVSRIYRQLSALQTMEMLLDGVKYDWLLNLQTLGNIGVFFSYMIKIHIEGSKVLWHTIQMFRYKVLYLLCYEFCLMHVLNVGMYKIQCVKERHSFERHSWSPLPK